MEFTKDIHFTSNLRGNETVGITYSGDLYKKGSESVSIVYGFGENWEHTTEKEMEKSETGFSAEIEIKDKFDTFNFCFRNGNYEWDNNQSFNYISGISPAVDSPKINPTFDSLFEEESELGSDFSTDFIMEILNGLLEENLNTSTPVNVETDKQQILDEILSENTEPVENAVYLEDFDMDALIDNILNPVINCTTSEIVGEDVTGGVEIEDAETSLGAVAAETLENGGVESGAENIENAENTGLVPTPENTYLVSPRKLRKFYLIQKKIKLAVYKLVVSIPKLLFGTFDEGNN